MRFRFVMVGAVLIGAPWIGGAAERNDRTGTVPQNDRTDAVRQIAGGVARVLGAAAACHEISLPRIKAMTDRLLGLIEAHAFNDGEFASIQRVYNERYIEGQRSVTGRQ